MKLSTRNLLTILLDFFELTLIGAAVFILVYFFVGQLVEVDGESMNPTFSSGEQIIAEKLTVKYKEPERGEVIIFNHPDAQRRLLIKRIVGLPNEIIMIENGNVFIEGKKLEEVYLGPNIVTESGHALEEGKEYKIASDSYVVMGDNREKSTDSREWGAVKVDRIIGRPLVVYYPMANFRLLPN